MSQVHQQSLGAPLAAVDQVQMLFGQCLLRAMLVITPKPAYFEVQPNSEQSDGRILDAPEVTTVMAARPGTTGWTWGGVTR
jgi:hypothetical protein